MSISQEIESKISILDLANTYLQTKKAGVNYKASCPFHTEKTPSFTISPAKNIAYCFSCHRGGGPIKFLMEIEKIEFRDALQILAKRAGVELQSTYANSINTEKNKDTYALYRYATEWYHEHLYSPDGVHALAYMHGRGMTDDILKRFQIGYSSSPRDMLYFLRSKGFDESFMVESGLFVSPTRDKFFGRVVFPIANFMGNTVAFTGRVMDTSLPKYLNSPASSIFDKSSTLYGIHLAKAAASKSRNIILVEGQMDTVALQRAGYTNTVGISGTALTKDHIHILKRFVDTVYLCLDSDNAGINATFASIENLLGEDIEIRVIQIPNGKDPDGYIQAGGDFTACIESSLSAISFFLQMGEKKYDIHTVIGKKKLAENCLRVIQGLSSDIERDIYIKEISDRIGVSVDTLFAEYKKLKRPAVHTSKEEIQKSDHVDFTYIERICAYIRRYNFSDLFFENFPYTKEQISTKRDFSLLSQVLAGTDIDEANTEKLNILDISLEEQYIDTSLDIVRTHFLDMVRTLALGIFVDVWTAKLTHIDPDSIEYLQVRTQCIADMRAAGYTDREREKVLKILTKSI